MNFLNLFSTFLFVLIITSVKCLEREITVSIEPKKEECFYQFANVNNIIDFEYQVIDGGHGDLDITFHLLDPTGRILVADFKKSEDNHRVDAKTSGDYRFCFDNTFSIFNSKTLFFELIIESDDNSEWDDDNIDFNGLRAEEVYDIKVQDILDAMNTVRNHLTKVRHYQDMLKSVEARDRNLVEENFFKVNTFSMVQIVVMLVVGVIQVVMVRSLFDYDSKIHKIWKNLNGSR